MSLSSERAAEKLPTVHVRRRYLQPLLLCAGFSLLLTGFALGHYYQRMGPWLSRAGIAITAALASFTGLQAADRRAKLTFSHEGLDVAVCQSGQILWKDVVHVECFQVRDQAAVAIFLTPESQARRTTAASHTMPVFAHEAFSGPPLWFTDEALECSAGEIAAEIDARRRGHGGPITKRALARHAQ